MLPNFHGAGVSILQRKFKFTTRYAALTCPWMFSQNYPRCRAWGDPERKNLLIALVKRNVTSYTRPICDVMKMIGSLKNKRLQITGC